MKQISLNSFIRVLGAAMLLVSLFLNWWEPGFDSVSAWTALEMVDIVLAAIALVALAASATLFHDWLPNSLRSIPILPLGVAATALIVVSLVNDPPAVIGAGHAFGIWFGLVGAVLITIGALLDEKRISIVVGDKTVATPATSADATAPTAVQTTSEQKSA